LFYEALRALLIGSDGLVVPPGEGLGVLVEEPATAVEAVDDFVTDDGAEGAVGNVARELVAEEGLLKHAGGEGDRVFGGDVGRVHFPSRVSTKVCKKTVSRLGRHGHLLGTLVEALSQNVVEVVGGNVQGLVIVGKRLGALQIDRRGAIVADSLGHVVNFLGGARLGIVRHPTQLDDACLELAANVASHVASKLAYAVGVRGSDEETAEYVVQVVL